MAEEHEDIVSDTLDQVTGCFPVFLVLMLGLGGVLGFLLLLLSRILIPRIRAHRE